MIVEIRDPIQLRAILNEINEKVIQAVSKQILEKLRNNIIAYIYEYEYFPNLKYIEGNDGMPSFEFLRAWKWDQIERLTTTVIRKLFYDWQSMGVDRGSYKHSSIAKGWPEDTREQLAGYLNVDGPTSGLAVGNSQGQWRFVSKLRKPYWDITIEELFDQDQLDYMFSKEYAKYGIKKG